MNSDAIFNVKFFSFHLSPSRIGQPPSFSSSDNMGAIPIFWKLQIYETSSLGDYNKINSTTWWMILFRWTWSHLKLRIVHASLISPFGHLIWHRLLLLHRLLQHHFQLTKQKCRWKLFSPGFWPCLLFFQIQCSTDTCGQESCCSWESCHRHISRNHRMVLHWCPCTQTFHLQHWHKSDIKKNLRFCFWSKMTKTLFESHFCSAVGGWGWWGNDWVLQWSIISSWSTCFGHLWNVSTYFGHLWNTAFCLWWWSSLLALLKDDTVTHSLLHIFLLWGTLQPKTINGNIPLKGKPNLKRHPLLPSSFAPSIVQAVHWGRWPSMSTFAYSTPPVETLVQHPHLQCVELRIICYPMLVEDSPLLIEFGQLFGSSCWALVKPRRKPAITKIWGHAMMFPSMLLKANRPGVSWQQLANEICWAIVHLLVTLSFRFLAQMYCIFFSR